MPLNVFLFLFLEIAAVSYLDIRTRKISNLWSVLNIVVYLLVVFLFPDIYKLLFSQMIFSLIFLGVGIVLFSFKLMGGGDSKFLASLFLVIPRNDQEIFLEYLLISTIFFGVIHLIVNSYQNKSRIWEGIKGNNIKNIVDVFGKKFPFAPVILISFMLMGVGKYFEG